jgi:hypothetical protein
LGGYGGVERVATGAENPLGYLSRLRLARGNGITVSTDYRARCAS